MGHLMRRQEDEGADFVFGRSRPRWPSERPSWYSSRFEGFFAILDYGEQPFIVTDRERPFYGLNFAGRRDAFVRLGGFTTGIGCIGDQGGVGEDLDLFQRAFDAGNRIAYEPAAVVEHVIPVARTTMRYHRRNMWRFTANYYKHLQKQFPEVPWLFGLPRFMFGRSASQVASFVSASVRRDQPEAYYWQLQCVRTARLVLEAGKQGFRRLEG
jgi:GT2 family glycosyltransferase